MRINVHAKIRKKKNSKSFVPMPKEHLVGGTFVSFGGSQLILVVFVAS